MPERKEPGQHTILVRVGMERGRRMDTGEWAAFRAANSLTRDTSVPQRIIAHRTRSAETIVTTWYSADGLLRVVTRETCAI